MNSWALKDVSIERILLNWNPFQEFSNSKVYVDLFLPMAALLSGVLWFLSVMGLLNRNVGE